ncbi:uncharacterized protein LACBIDRAFT_299428 [Laccaria bicolor S238N-H82]|uniref:Predicted protein n=1 Tax=Laccaria bicolor (strain S238N-H82 / ATCC MYA-4686) TaxID=486041 RepID=B0DEK3_LACBS|nr:uncharacterized protein LACBIDRAFT_299357 [Laccaria bicolor S238N-H82]XP_001882345.1 uncharacterized protein LACBIDRAFT_299428 [Laccaria bicolor S238N-H82]EDR06949.1 predicted protein [Laccaria bicolor S238N-H82]EDR06972.1 predicted protein [Laccaria bicolor S238N-H82]|eukprot:XP_001882322.1 predicted protein [Laccaria bicolor S238N-H82]
MPNCHLIGGPEDHANSASYTIHSAFSSSVSKSSSKSSSGSITHDKDTVMEEAEHGPWYGNKE